MACTGLFLLLFETSDRPTRYVKTVSDATEASERDYLDRFKFYADYFETENCEKYYDSINIKSHLSEFDTESYPDVGFRLRQILEQWNDWRENTDPSGSFLIFGHEEISDHILCEAARQQYYNNDNTYIILNHEALTIQNENIELTVDGNPISLKALPLHKTHEWFASNRRPMRTYHPSPKHGENGRGQQPNASPLLCSHREAAEMMHKAIKYGKALFWYDNSQTSFITFRDENTSENTYHAYHTDAIPQDIKEKIRQLQQA